MSRRLTAQKRPGSGWHFTRYGWRGALFAIPRIGNYRLHCRVHLTKPSVDGAALGVWWGPDDDDGPWDLTIVVGTFTVVFFVAEFHPWPYTPPPWMEET